MLETSQPWVLFGYDLSNSLHFFRAGWNEFLWGEESPVFPAVDEVVLAHLEDGSVQHYRAGHPVDVMPADTVRSSAVVLPANLALSKSLTLPLAVEANLAAALHMEVLSSSPFPAEDTCHGWKVSGRTEENIEVQLVISSRSAVMEYVSAEHASHDVQAYEIWAVAENRMVTLSGFGEAMRQQRNRARLFKMAATLLYAMAVIVALFAVATGAKYLELQKVQEQQAQAIAIAKEAVELRENLASARMMIGHADAYLLEHPSPHRELKRIAALLDDETWLSMAEVRGGVVKIEGESSDASAVMQELVDTPAYALVEAPVAISKQRSGLERFVLNLSLAQTQDEAQAQIPGQAGVSE